MISADSNSVPFACAIGMEFYPQSYLLCPYLFYIFHQYSFISLGMTFLIIEAQAGLELALPSGITDYTCSYGLL